MADETLIRGGRNLDVVVKGEHPAFHPAGPVRVGLARVSTLDQVHKIQIAELIKEGVADALIFTEAERRTALGRTP